VAHHVSLMAVQAEAATSLLPGRPAEAAQSVEVIAATARQALTELRRLLGVLRGPADQLETAPSVSLADLETVLDQVRGSGLAVDLTVQGTPGPLAPGVDLTAYRIIQEALTNSVRHANAARAAVTLCYEPGFVTVSVTDTRRDGGTVPVVNGTMNAPVGATPVNGSLGPATAGPASTGPASTGPASTGPASTGQATAGHASPGHASLANGSGGGTAARGREVPARSGGFGLAGIAERVASCGGHLSVGPTAAGGFAVTARLPAQ
jgi:signal transduction histidine kinase